MIFQGRYSQHLTRWDLIAFYIPFSIRSAIHIQFPYECAHLLQAQSCPWDSQCLGAAECAQPLGTPLVNQLTPPSLSLYTLVPKSECTIRQWLSSFPDASLRPLQLRRGQQDEVWIAQSEATTQDSNNQNGNLYRSLDEKFVRSGLILKCLTPQEKCGNLQSFSFLLSQEASTG